MSDNCCSCHTKHRSDDERKKLINRLSRIEGQIRGIKGMVEMTLIVLTFLYSPLLYLQL